MKIQEIVINIFLYLFLLHTQNSINFGEKEWYSKFYKGETFQIYESINPFDDSVIKKIFNVFTCYDSIFEKKGVFILPFVA